METSQQGLMVMTIVDCGGLQFCLDVLQLLVSASMTPAE